MRYNWKYFPMKRLWGLTILTFFSQTVHAIASGIPLSVYFEGIFSMLAVIIHTYRNERVVVPPEKLYDITLGVSMTKAQINYFKILIRNKFKEIWKK